MLFPFDETQITFKKIKMKSISTMMGGVLTYLDEHNSTDDKEVFLRMQVSDSLARLYKTRYKIAQYMKPQEVCLMMYGDRVVGIEKHIVNERFERNRKNELVEWRSFLEINFVKALAKMKVIGEDWMFDGSFIYRFMQSGIETVFSKGINLSDDGKFRSVSVDAIRVGLLNDIDGPLLITRQCLCYSPDGKHVAVTPPIWGSIGASRSIKKGEDSEGQGLTAHFDSINQAMALNLNFALTAGTQLSRQFGYRSIEALQLPKLMIQLKTVNLPNLTAGVKATFDIGMQYKQALGWLMGLLYRSETFDDMVVLRGLIKYATGRGLFRKESVTKMRQVDAIVPLYTVAEALAKAEAQSTISLSMIRQAEDILDAIGA
jgi:hypothetical protein